MLRKIAAGFRRIFASPRPRLDRLDYDDYWDERQVGIVQPRFAVIARHINNGASVADIGCGDGSLLEFLADRRHARGWGMDISRRGVEAAQRRGIDCVVGDVTNSEFALPRQFDVIVISEVLEHVADPERVLRRLRQSGAQKLIVTIPNTGYIEHRLRLLFGRFPVQWLFHPGEHLRFWTIQDFRVTATATGFLVEVVEPALGWFPFARLMPSLFASQVVFVLTPRRAA